MPESVKELFEYLKQDRANPEPRYPQTAAQAFTNPATRSAVEKRLAGGQRLSRIRSLGFNPVTALEQLVFEFQSESRLGIGVPAMLVLINQQGYAAGLIDPYDAIPDDRLVGRTTPGRRRSCC